MKGADFFVFLDYFIRHARPSPEHKCLLLLDNHQSYLSIKCLDHCKRYGIVVLSFPPHATNKLQPLDRGVFGPIKEYFDTACDTWMRLPENAANPITIYDIPRIAQNPIESGASISNIESGFAVTGIWPLSTNVFTDHDFLPSQITDHANVDERPPTPDLSDTEEERAAVDDDVEDDEEENDLDGESDEDE